MTRKQKILLLLLSSLNFTHILDFMIMMPLGNFLMPHFNISAGFFSWIVAAYPVTAFFSGMATAFSVDKYDRKKVLLFAYIGFLIGTITCGIAPDPYVLLSARILTGLFGGLINTQVLSIVADSFEYELRGRAMASVFAAFSIASVFGVPFSLYLAKLISWHAPFIFIGIVGVLIIPLIVRYMPPMRKHLDEHEGERLKARQVLANMLNDKNQLIALALSALLMLGHFLTIPFINPYMEFNVGFTKDQTPMIYMVGGTCAFFTSFVIGRLSDKYGKLRIFMICAICSLLPVFLITNMPPIPFYYVLIVFGFWFSFSSGRSIPAQAMISNVVSPAHRGQFMSFNSSFQQLFTGLASIISGLIVKTGNDGKIYHYHWVGYLSVAVIFSTLFIANELARRQNL